MATRPADDQASIAELLRHAKKECRRSLADLWSSYSEIVGDDSGKAAFKSWLYGWTVPPVDRYDVVAQVLNAALVEADKEPFLPRLYAPPAPWGGGARPSESGPNGIRHRSVRRAERPLTAVPDAA